VFLDVDLDGYEDILISSGAIHGVQDRDTLAALQATGRPPQASHVLAYPAFPSPVSAFRNLGGFRFEDVHERWGFTRTNLFQTTALADLDDDGDLDLVTSCLNASPGIYRNDSSAPRISVRAKGSGKNTRGVNARIRVRGGPVDQEQEIVSGGRYVGGDDAVRTFACGDAKAFEIEVRWRSGAVSRITNARPNHRYVVDETVTDPAGARDTRPSKVQPVFADVSGALSHTHREELFDDFARQPLLHRQLSAAGPTIATAVIALGLVAPAATTVEAVQLNDDAPAAPVQLQPAPVGVEVSVRPAGSRSSMVYGPLVAISPRLSTRIE
jgi:hypothetical protein